MTGPDRVPAESVPQLLRALACRGQDGVPCSDCPDVWSPARVSVAAPPDEERTSPSTTHDALTQILAAMVREALDYERRHGREAA